MNPRSRCDWPRLFAELREWISAIPEPRHTMIAARCDGCEQELILLFGSHSQKWFWSHRGNEGCDARAIFFPTKQAALEAEKVFL